MATQEQSRTPFLGQEHILSQMWKNQCKTLLCFAELHLPNSSTQIWGQHPFCKSQPPNHNLFLSHKWAFQLKAQNSLNLKAETKIFQVKQYLSFPCKPPLRRKWLQVFASSIIANAVKNIKPLCCNKSLQLWAVLHPHRLRFQMKPAEREGSQHVPPGLCQLGC